MTAIRATLALLAAGLAGPAMATCRDITFEAQPYTVCEARAGQDDLRIFHMADDGLPIGTFDRLAAKLAQTGQTITFAMNAGMFRPDRAPVGLLVSEGEERSRLLTGRSAGNFGMLPNGVFCIGAESYAVIESRAFAARRPECRYATQSGPMLVIDGKLHPRFRANAQSVNIRNGVGVSADGKTAFFAISDVPVTFEAFARLFRDRLSTPNALFFDGSISRLDAPELGRTDIGLPVGPMVAGVRPLDAPGPSE